MNKEEKRIITLTTASHSLVHLCCDGKLCYPFRYEDLADLLKRAIGFP